jgi:hypothetical protein
MVEKIMFSFFRVIFDLVKNFVLQNKEPIKKILWELLISVIKHVRESREEQQKQNENNNSNEQTTASMN